MRTNAQFVVGTATGEGAQDGVLSADDDEVVSSWMLRMNSIQCVALPILVTLCGTVSKCW